MLILESLILYACLIYALVLFYNLIMKEDSVATDIDSNYAEYRLELLIGEDE